MSHAPEEEVVVVAEHVGVRRERLQLLVRGHRRIAHGNVSLKSRGRVGPLDESQEVDEQRRHRQLNHLERARYVSAFMLQFGFG